MNYKFKVMKYNNGVGGIRELLWGLWAILSDQATNSDYKAYRENLSNGTEFDTVYIPRLQKSLSNPQKRTCWVISHDLFWIFCTKVVLLLLL